MEGYEPLGRSLRETLEDNEPYRGKWSEFDAKFAKAFDQLRYERGSQPVLAAFSDAYAYKHEFPLKAESRDGGLAYALHEALSGYPDPQLISLESLGPYSGREVSMYVVDEIQRIIQSRAGRLIIHDFQHFLLNARGMDPKAVSLEELKSEIRAGLANYGLNRDRGLSTDPLH